jgi:hypothetical protein
MRVTPDEDEQAVGDLARQFFAGRAALARQRDAASRPAAAPRALFAELGELDVFGQSLPEEAGGLGLGRLGPGLVVEAAGREVAPGPLIDQLVAVAALADEPELIAGLVAGTQLAAIAFCDLAVDRKAGTVEGDVTGLHLGDLVDRWVLITPAAVVVVDRSAIGAGALVADQAIDPLRPVVSTTLRAAPAVAIVSRGPGERDRQLAYTCGLTAMWSVGAAQRLLEDTVAYIKDREQFGRPVGSFQAMKHRAADAYIEILHARCLAEAALASGGDGDLHIARVAADRVYRSVSANALHMHGGIGFTAESTVHLFLKNAELLRRWPVPVGRDLALIRETLGMDAPAVDV